ncbi:MAG TPA: cyclase family protein, partial [Thermomicrobiales bacterium]|nr:cyclase family protein [Thermomicrobiales bacterium]
MWSYGAPLPPVAVTPAATLERDGWNGHALSLHTLAGTYVEAADHLFPNRETVSDLPLERFITRAVVAQLPDKAPLEPVTARELEAAVPDDPRGAALLVATGWDAMWGQPGYVERCPYFLPAAMAWVVAHGVRLLGLDVPCVQDPRHDDGALTRVFFAEDRLLLAPLVNLRQAGSGQQTLVALPLNIPGVCGTPVRAVLIDGVRWND